MMRQVDSLLQANRGNLESLIKSYEATIFQARDRELFDAFKKLYGTYAPAQEAVLKLSSVNNNREAHTQLNNFEPVFEKVRGALQAVVEYNKINADDATQQIFQAISTANASILATFGIALLLAFVCGIYLLRAHGLDAKRTGFIVGAMMLVSVIVNPLFVYFSGGRRRLPTLSAMLVLGGLVVMTLPMWPLAGVLPVMCLFQTFQLGSYAVSDAATLERVPANVRGRVVGLFLLFAGTFASTGPWVMGAWTDWLGERAHEPMAYLPLFGTLGALMVLAAFSTPLIARLGVQDQGAIEAMSEIAPATMEPTV